MQFIKNRTIQRRPIWTLMSVCVGMSKNFSVTQISTQYKQTHVQTNLLLFSESFPQAFAAHMTLEELWPHSVWLGSTVLCLLPFFCTLFCFSVPALFLLRPAVETALLHPHKQALFSSSPLSVWAGELSLPSAPSWYIYTGIQPMHLRFYSLPLRHSGHKKQSLTLPKTYFVFSHHSGLTSILVSLTY